MQKGTEALKSVIFFFLEEDASAAMVGQIYGYSKQKAIGENAVRHSIFMDDKGKPMCAI